MPLIVLNPTPNPKPRKGSKRGGTMKKRRSPAQRAATARMLRARKGLKRHHNPSAKRPTKHYKVSARRHHNPSVKRHVYKGRRRKVTRNPALFSTGGLFGELMSVEGLMMTATVVAMPTITELATTMIAPSLTGYGRVGVKAGIGVAASVVLDKIVGRKVALIAALLAIGTGVMEAVKVYQGTPGYGSPSSSSFVGPTLPAGQSSGYALGGRTKATHAARALQMRGYGAQTGAPFMSGYAMGGPFPEPGTR